MKCSKQTVERKIFYSSFSPSSVDLLLPLYLFLFVVVLVFVSGSLIMLLINFLPAMSPFIEVLLNSALLVIFIAPAIYIFFFEPLVSHVKEFYRAKIELEEAYHNLELRKEVAESTSRAKSEFLSNMSHELRTPMHAILSFSSMGMDKSGSLEDKHFLRYFSHIRQSGKKLLFLLNDLLNLSQLEAGKAEFDFKDNDLMQITERQIDELSYLLKEKSLVVETAPSGIGMNAFVDRKKIAQVVWNVLSNAIKFSPKGGKINVSFNSSTASVEDGARDGVPHIFMKVSDQGIGIPSEELESVFNKFIQSSKTKTGAGGTGLGLAISKNIILAHGGIINARNNANGGAQFSIKIPVRHNAEVLR